MFLEIVLAFLQAAPGQGLLFLLFFLCGIGAPVSQDLLLLAATGTVLRGQVGALPLAVLAFAGLFLGDLVTFWTGRHYGARWIRARWAQGIVAPQRLPALEEGTRGHGFVLAFVARFLPGQRATLYFAYGTLRMPYRTFLCADAIAMALYVALLVHGARVLGWQWEALRGRLDTADDLLTGALLVVFLLWAFRGPRQPGR